MSTDPTRTAIGTWSGGRYIHFGEPLDDERYLRLITPDAQIPTVLSADVYGTGEADIWLGRALKHAFDSARPADQRLTREEVCVVGAVGHDFYEGERNGSKGFPRFTDASLRGPDQYASYLRMATERSLERCGIDRFDLLLLHNPDRAGYTSEHVWNGMQALKDAGLTRMVGVSPGPANGFTLDLIDCLERFGSQIDYAMVILNPLEPWPGEFCLDAGAKNGVEVMTRVVDYGGLLYDDLAPDAVLGRTDHRSFRPDGWIVAGHEKLARLRPIAERAGLTMIQLACQWNLAHPAVKTVVPTLLQEAGPNARPVEEKRAELASLPSEPRLSADDVEAIRVIGDNTHSMALKGANPAFSGEEQPDRWTMSERLEQVAARWSIDPARDLAKG